MSFVLSYKKQQFIVEGGSTERDFYRGIGVSGLLKVESEVGIQRKMFFRVSFYISYKKIVVFIK